MAKTNWSIDPTHSEIGFKVKHMMFTNVSGKFKSFEATVVNEDDKFESSNISFIADVNSIDTNNTDRDNHLRSADFFDVEHNEKLSFRGTSFIKLDDENYRLEGLLSIKGVEKEIVLDVEFGGINKDPWGNEKAGFSVSGKLNRKDWGLNWNAALETGGVLVSDEVKISAEVQFVKQA